MTVADLWLRPDGALDGRASRVRRHRRAGGARGAAVRDRGGRRGLTCDARTLGPPMTVYVAEEFTPDEADVLRRYFTNLDGPVFALVNLPEVVKGALFARYSRSLEEPAAAVPRRVRRRSRHHRRRRRSTPPSACAGPRSSTTGCSSSTATTRSPSSAACTWRASRRRTCSPRCSSGAG